MGSERERELRRRNSRKRSLQKIAKRAKTATPSEKEVLAAKIRRLTPGANEIIERLELQSK